MLPVYLTSRLPDPVSFALELKRKGFVPLYVLLLGLGAGLSLIVMFCTEDDV